MLNWLFKPSCPCDEAAKAWVEKRLAWLAEEFDDSAFNGRRIVLPTPDFFPGRYDGSESAAQALFDQVCDYMDVAPYDVQLEFIDKASRVSGINLVNEAGQDLALAATGGYLDGLIQIDVSGLGDPHNLIGTIAHELAHQRLLGENRVSRTVFDNELLTDLTTVHFGLGIFLANSPRAWESGMKIWPGTTLKKPEYMSSPMYGWALAHLAWFRGEEHPAWAKYLSSGPRANVKQGIDYLFAAGDSDYKPVRMRQRKR